MAKRMNHDSYIEKVKEIRGNEIEIISTFTGSAKPISYRCNTCGTEAEVKHATDLVSKKAQKRKHNCRNCFWIEKNKRRSEEARQKYMSVIEEHPITIKKSFRDDVEKKWYFDLSCNECDHEWTLLGSNMKSKWKGCPACWKKSDEFKRGVLKGLTKRRDTVMLTTKSKFLAFLEESDEIKMLGQYISSKQHTKFGCKKCGHEWETSPAHVMNSGSGCPRCKSGWTESSEGYESAVEEIHGGRIVVLGEYISAYEKIEHQCTECDTNWLARPSTIKKGTGCPSCKSSKGEREIKKFLERKGIDYVQEWKEHECRNIKRLPFDFYVPEHNIAIEFQGIQHERYIEFFHRSEAKFKEQQKRDSIKRNYCKAHNIHYLEIWYHQMEDVVDILDTYLEEIKEEKNESTVS